MGFRTVIISESCKLEYSLNYLIWRNSNEEKKILIDEINTIIIQSTRVAITTALISELVSNNVKIIFCDAKSNPQSEVMGYYGTYDSYDKLLIQSSFTEESKQKVWTRIIEEKIYNQAKNLFSINYEKYKQLMEYYNNVLIGDISNREGHAAKVYFNTIFGKEFSRNQEIDINTYLNYGYSILLSSINRIVKSLGYYTELGIHHIGKTNPYNFSCDLIEPLRPVVDYMVISGELKIETYKKQLIELVNKEVCISENKMYFENAIKIYVQSIISALKCNDSNLIKFIQYEL